MFGSEAAGYNANRRIFEEGADVGEEIESLRSTMPLPAFQIAVVVDVFPNPKKLDPQFIESLKQATSTPELVERMPMNSITGRTITRNQDLYDSSPRIFFPVNVFDAEPVKPGEQVFVFFVDQASNDQIGYWWRRVPQPMDTDDLSFTHADRKYQSNDGSTATDKLVGKTKGPPNFINGGEQEEQHTLAGANAYEEINDNAQANAQIVKEATARFTKRPGDKTIMGSNGSRIVLGMDRAAPGPASADTPVRPNSATMDLVVGAGRAGTPTAPTTVVNSRGEEEVDKNPQTPDNPIEGDPDMINDPSRIYISESTDVDVNFAVNIPGIPPAVGPAPSLAAKSDRLRFLAREDIKIAAASNALVLDQIGNVSVIGAPRINLGSAFPIQPIVHGTSLVSALTTYVSTVTIATAALNTAAQAYFAIPVPTPPQQVTFQSAWVAYNTAIANAQSTLVVALQNSLSTKVFTD